MQTISKWGNSLALRVPSAFAEALGFSDGTEVALEVKSGKLIVEAVRTGKEDLQSLVDRITPENRHKVVAWGKRAGKEVW